MRAERAGPAGTRPTPPPRRPHPDANAGRGLRVRNCSPNPDLGDGGQMLKTWEREGGKKKKKKESLRADGIIICANSQNKQLSSFANYCGRKPALPWNVLIWTNKFCTLLSW